MIDVILNPAELAGADLSQSQVVVLDVLRATSTIVTALANGARAVRLFDSLEGARAARRAWGSGGEGGEGPVVLAGEEKCLMPADLDGKSVL